MVVHLGPVHGRGDADGNWVGRLRPRLMLGMVVWVVVLSGWLTLAVVVARLG